MRKSFEIVNTWFKYEKEQETLVEQDGMVNVFSRRVFLLKLLLKQILDSI